MKHVVVIGGGLSGLTSSFYLSEQNIKVTLIEASPKLGGRTYSLADSEADDFYDNGQHIMMGCYDETLELLKKTNSYQNLYIQSQLDIPFVEKGGQIFRLRSSKYFYPLNMLIGLLHYRAISLKSRFKVIDFFLDLMCCFAEDLADKNVKQWLNCKTQSHESVRRLWEILVIGTMNTTLENASAEIFNEVLKEIFLNGNFSSKVVIPKVDLSSLFVQPVKNKIEEGGIIHIGERVKEIVVTDNLINRINTDKRFYEDFDGVIIAVPPHALKKIKFSSADGSQFDYFDNEPLGNFEYSPILNVHLWLSENPFTEKFYGLLESKIHWVFNSGGHISLTTSSATDLIDLNNDKIFLEFCSELERYFPIFNARFVKSWKVIKEKRATFIPSIESQKVRKRFSSNYGNLFLAGDWIENGLPSTIESAVLNGRLAAKSLIDFLKLASQ